ncbi:hypothetical protein [Pseudomonas sp. TWP3-2]|uniref:hypothetical protein n=1 Tax=Pseudomonas sp. TWP3-2 TaxID=2804574 RepID=UPI003CEB9B81
MTIQRQKTHLKYKKNKEKMLINEIEKLDGTINFDDISQVDQSSEISLIVDELKEDLFQASLPFEQILDIGWYPEFSETGAFKVSLIEHLDWENPIHSEKAKNWTDLKIALENTLKKVRIK